jgi:hypothetical protein
VKKKKKADKKKTPGKKKGTKQMRQDLAGIAEILALLVAHENTRSEKEANGLADEVTVSWATRLVEIRDRWGLQLQ